MGLFNNRNQNESAYVGGKKHWADIIKNSGNGDFLIWRQPEEDFNTNSTLVVMPGEEAIFINGGNIEQIFTNGTYKLTTQNYPFISRLRNAFSGGVSSFNCCVYFVRIAQSQEIEWGTMSPIQYYDDTFGNLNIKSYGAFKIHIDNGAKFLTKILGNNVDFETQQDLKKYFMNEFQMHIVNSLSNAIDKLKASGKIIFETVHNTVEIAKEIETHIAPIVKDYGLKLDTFSVASCKIASDDPEIQKMITDRVRLNYLGQNWMIQQQIDILKSIANNPESGGIIATAASLGLGMTAGSVFNNIGQQTMQDQTVQNSATNSNSIKDKLRQLKELFDMGLISQSDFDTKKSEILSNM